MALSALHCSRGLLPSSSPLASVLLSGHSHSNGGAFPRIHPSIHRRSFSTTNTTATTATKERVYTRWTPLPQDRLWDRSTKPAEDLSRTRAPGTTKLLALEDLQDNPGARHRKIRVGRGRSGRRGKTAGRGHKGIHQRRAVGRIWYEGGQTPLARMIPKVGQRDAHPRRRPVVVNLDRIMNWIRMGRLSAEYPIDMRSLLRSGCVTRIKKDGVKVLGEGAEHLDFPIHLMVTDASKSVIEAVERAGGKVELVYFNRRGLRAHLYPEDFPIPPRSPGYPPPKLAPKYGLPPKHYAVRQASKYVDPTLLAQTQAQATMEESGQKLGMEEEEKQELGQGQE